MPKNNVVIAVNGTEQEFISAFIKSVMNESAFSGNNPKHTLKCEIGTTESGVDETDIADVDAKLNTVFSNTSNYPRFIFTIDENAKIEFRRISSLDTDSYYIVYTTINGVYLGDANIEYAEYTKKSNVTSMRIWKYQILSNDNVLYLVFGTYSEEFPLSKIVKGGNYLKAYQAFFYKKGVERVGGLCTTGYLYNAEKAQLSLQNRLKYVNNTTDPTAIEIIKNKVLILYGGTGKIMTIDNIWDSSFNSAVMFPVNIDNKEYVYLDNYTLMPI